MDLFSWNGCEGSGGVGLMVFQELKQSVNRSSACAAVDLVMRRRASFHDPNTDE